MIKKLIAGIINWACKDEMVTVGSIKVMHPKTTYTDTIAEKTTNAGVQISRMRTDTGAAFPGSPVVGQMYYLVAHATYPNGLYIYTNDAVGTIGGWFPLKHALYAANTY